VEKCKWQDLRFATEPNLHRRLLLLASPATQVRLVHPSLAKGAKGSGLALLWQDGLAVFRQQAKLAVVLHNFWDYLAPGIIWRVTALREQLGLHGSELAR
jgi:glycine cleavage system regulatory protein